ncbi:hypothetical protein PVAND_007423 [Polypedilum vanderplanki]|uniref:Uncharacterized protein n=2 Tax=Polypedilum vanderplanki TaxID=319348 RepID=A0A9J6C6V0_POLVA|nr:hypothetical protein PVAND_007423 [Polypedilum vanderplanki]
MDDSFYIKVFSNSCENLYAENTLSHFKTQLNQTLKFNREYEVALKEIYINKICNHHVESETKDFVVLSNKIETIVPQKPYHDLLDAKNQGLRAEAPKPLPLKDVVKSILICARSIEIYDDEFFDEYLSNIHFDSQNLKKIFKDDFLQLLPPDAGKDEKYYFTFSLKKDVLNNEIRPFLPKIATVKHLYVKFLSFLETTSFYLPKQNYPNLTMKNILLYILTQFNNHLRRYFDGKQTRHEENELNNLMRESAKSNDEAIFNSIKFERQVDKILYLFTHKFVHHVKEVGAEILREIGEELKRKDYFIIVSTNIIQHSLIGDQSSKVLRCIVIEDREKQIFKEFNTLEYHKVNFTTLRTLEIQLSSISGEKIDFENSSRPTYLNLHFRRIKE